MKVKIVKMNFLNICVKIYKMCFNVFKSVYMHTLIDMCLNRLMYTVIFFFFANFVEYLENKPPFHRKVH